MVYAQNAEYKRLFQEASQLRFSQPQKSLKLFDYLLKNNSGKEAMAIENRRLQINRILGNYIEAAKISKKIEDDLLQAATPSLEFEYFNELASLYFDLDLDVEREKTYKEASEKYGELSKEEQDNFYVNHFLTKLEYDQNLNERGKIQELKNILADVANGDPYNLWIHYKIGKLFFPISKDSAASYLQTLTVSDTTSYLSRSAILYLDLISTDVINSIDYKKNGALPDKDLQYFLIRRKIEYWEEKRDWDSLQIYQNRFREITNHMNFERRQAKVALIQHKYYSHKENATIEYNLGRKRIWVGIVVLGLLLIAYIGFKFFQRQKREGFKDNDEPEEPSKGIVIPDRTELEILEKLKDFENSNLFLDKQLRLATLAKQLDTNTRYLSSIINSAKGKTFNNYINSLRIQYILNKLDNDPKFLTYKISYLADESGFASQSSFTTAFKDFTGSTPSAYIKNLLLDT